MSSPNAPASDKANPPLCLSSKVQFNKHSLGEGSDAGKWFESTNNTVQSNPSFANTAPDTPPDGHTLYDHSCHQASIPCRLSKSRLDTDSRNSTIEDLRSVIDDLTIANKRLKQSLKKYEKLGDDHLQDEKLFEVCFHGLPNNKKRELEGILRKFAAGIEDSPTTDYSVIPSYPPPFNFQKNASSHASHSAEFGYASMATFGQNSAFTPWSQVTDHDRDYRHMNKSQYNQQRRSVKSYLDDIPIGSLPKNHVPMTEKFQKKVVVRRLEQIFAGRRSTPGSHPQPMQQEEVAQLTAMADRCAREATGQCFKSEGNREARITPARADLEDITQIESSLLQKLRPILHVHEHDFAGSGSPNQRPTRPLDLDLNRAQVPIENMNYIRHLGFTPPGMISKESLPGDYGWLYLNLLISMAQLHTLNVTLDFVKDAIIEYSSKLELSRDGRKVRWRGNQDATKSNCDNSSEYREGDSRYDVFGNSKSPVKRIRISPHSSTNLNSGPEHKTQRNGLVQDKGARKFNCTPYKEDLYNDEDLYGFHVGSSSHSPCQALQTDKSSGFGSSATPSSLYKRNCDNGPMVFYSKAKFCTDLTSDRHSDLNHVSKYYAGNAGCLLGAPIQQVAIHNYGSDFGEPRGLFGSSMMDMDSKENGQMSSSSEDIAFLLDDLKDDTGTETLDVMEFKASGLGGVHLGDNFSIRVRRSQLQITPSSTWSTRHKPRLYPKKILDALNECSPLEAKASLLRQQHVIKEEVLSVSLTLLPNSTLPPASFLPFDSTSSENVDSDLECALF
ncbi:hypothetical protein DM02DRAFT_677147 [Periconia macrospinosa]|uniref:Frequency clock protein n=1 Tax=Periconia macrospinosa TaxID=97972 RepID=A0A2V1D606_9PLEO|nr:hypothetical protein DM02DRAFT_677147 [Periconia macrospinosa]